MTHILRYTRVSPLFDEMPLATESDERKLYITWVNQSLHGLGKWWTEFTTDEFKFRSVIAFTIGLSQFRVTKNGRESLKLIFKKGLKTWNPNFRLEFSNQENNRMHLFRRSVFFRNFPLKRRKQPETELMVSLAKHHAVASWFTHDVIQVYRLLFGIHVAFLQFWDRGVLPIMADTGRFRPKGVSFSGFRYMKG